MAEAAGVSERRVYEAGGGRKTALTLAFLILLPFYASLPAMLVQRLISGLWFEGKFDAMLHWWHMPADPELTLFFASDRTPPNGRNINYVDDDSLTRLLYASDRTVDYEKRRALLVAAQQRIAELAVEIPLYNVTRLDAVPSTLEGFTGNPTNAGIFWNVHQWRIR